MVCNSSNSRSCVSDITKVELLHVKTTDLLHLYFTFIMTARRDGVTSTLVALHCFSESFKLGFCDFTACFWCLEWTGTCLYLWFANSSQAWLLLEILWHGPCIQYLGPAVGELHAWGSQAGKLSIILELFLNLTNDVSLFFLHRWYFLVFVLANHLTISNPHPLLYLTTWACSLVLFAFTICFFFIGSSKYLNGAILIKLLLYLKLAWHLSNVKDEYASHEKTCVSVLSDFSGLLVPTGDGNTSKQVTEICNKGQMISWKGWAL